MATQALDRAIKDLRSTLRGQVITPSNDNYDEARTIWNGDIDRRPAIIARCSSVDDVRAALAFGRSNDLAIAVKSGGHSMPGFSMVDDALVIDTRPMNEVKVDVKAKRATVQGGALWSELDSATQEHGLAVTGGEVSHTGVAGLTLGGGFGHLARKLGLAVDNLLEVQIVTADGEVLRANADENADLFWAVRGGGGNFGIVTEFVFKLSPIGPTVLGGLAFYAADQGPEFLRRYSAFCANCPDEVRTEVGYLHAPPMDFVPKDVQLKPGYAMVVCGTDVDLAEKTVAEMRKFGPPLFDVIGPMPYLALQSMFDTALAPGTRTYTKARNLNALTDGAIDAITSSCAKMPPGRSMAFLMQMGGAVNRVPDDATAYGGRTAAFQAAFFGIWESEGDKQVNADWARAAWKTLEPHAEGAYVNLSDTQDLTALEQTYGKAKFEKLRKIKAKYDPENVFRLNQNIPPAGK